MLNETLFMPLRIRRHSIIDGEKSLYRVYRAAGDFLTVEARSALEAHRKSGLKDATSVRKITKYLHASLQREALGKPKEFIETPLLGGLKIIPADAPAPTAEDGLVFEVVVAAPDRVGANFLSKKAEQELLNAAAALDSQPTAAAAQSTSNELEGFEEILPTSTPVARQADARHTTIEITEEAEGLKIVEAAPAQASAAIPGAGGKVLSPDEVKSLLGGGT